MATRSETVQNLRTVFASFGEVVGRIPAEGWQVQSLCPAWTVRGVVHHVTTVESALVGWRPGGDSPFSAMPAIAEELAQLDDAALLARYQDITALRIEDLATMTETEFDEPSITPVGPGTYAGFMRIRVFDVWVHERDIRVPLGLTGDDSGPAAEMSLDEVQSSIGFIVGKKIGLADGSSIQIDLTGPVTRTLCARVEGRAAAVDHLDDPTITLSMDSLTFMQLACGRIDPEGPIADGRVTWSGDEALAAHAARHLAFTL